MKILLLATFAATLTLTLLAQPAAPPSPGAPPVYIYDQKPLAQLPVLIDVKQAQSIVEQFHTNYSKSGSPRVLIYVNRELVDEQSGLKLSSRSEHVATTRRVDSTSSGTNAATNKVSTTTRTSGNNYYYDNGKPAASLADRQTVRDVERLMGRPLRAAGAALVDQRVAAQLLGGHPMDSLNLESEIGRKDREAVGKIADIVIEVLITSRNVTVQEVSGDKVYSVPDIQATAIRLKDSRIVGQATAADVIARGGGPGYAARNFGVQAITEATSLALMENMLQEAN